MAIDGIGLSLNRLAASQAYGVGAPSGSTKAPADAHPAPQRDGVELSAAGREWRAARAAIAALPDVREERLAAVQAAVASGTYQIDSAALARKLLGVA